MDAVTVLPENIAVDSPSVRELIKRIFYRMCRIQAGQRGGSRTYF